MASGPNRLRTLLSGDGITAAPGAYDVLSARIAARAGHILVYLGGNAMALGLGKGQPFLTLTETVDITARVARNVDVPLIVDAGAGFGDAAHLDTTVADLEAAGAAAIHIDDQPYPKSVDYHRGRGTLVSVDAMAARIRTACAARRDMLIIARTDALRVSGDMAETIDRAKVYRDAGADALIVLDLGPDRLAEVRQALPGLPIIWIGGVAAPIPTLEMLGGAGFDVALYPFSAVAGVTAALGDLWNGLARTGGIEQSDALLARARKETLEIVEMARFWAIEDRNS